THVLVGFEPVAGPPGTGEQIRQVVPGDLVWVLLDHPRDADRRPAQVVAQPVRVGRRLVVADAELLWVHRGSSSGRRAAFSWCRGGPSRGGVRAVFWGSPPGR